MGDMAKDYSKLPYCRICKRKLSIVYGTDYYWKCNCKDEINQKRIDRISLSQEQRDKEKRIEKYKGHKSLVRFLWCMTGGNATRYEIILAKLGDTLIKESEYYILNQVAKQLNLEVKMRTEISDYQRRKRPRVKIGKYTYYLMPFNCSGSS